jgi:hypothetical protein
VTNGSPQLDDANYIQLNYTVPRSCAGIAVYRNGVLVGACSENNFRDAGGTFVDLYNLPTSPPASACNGWLITTIASGGGALSLRLNATASNKVSNETIQHDDTASIAAAVSARQCRGFFRHGVSRVLLCAKRLFSSRHLLD